MWRRTEVRAAGQDLKGRPTIEQLLSARRAEQILGDMLVTHSRPGECRHVVCAAANALSALANLIMFDAAVTYLSFPITVPLDMKNTDKDDSFIKVINEAHKLAARSMKDNKRAFITPLAIDELPVLDKLPAATGSDVTYSALSDRWNQNELWGDADVAILPAVKDAFSIPVEQLKNADGGMRTDVGWRDRRLVLQSKSLAIVCPKDPRKDRITRGVSNEIATATAVGIPCHYWQKPEWDAKNYVGSQFPTAGSMGPGHVEMLVQRADSLEALIAAKP